MISFARSFFIFSFLLLLLALPTFTWAQLEVGAGYSHLTGNNGLDGFGVSLGYEFNRHVVLVGQGDFLWDTSRPTVFDLSPQTGTIRIKSNFQQYLAGARIRILGWKYTKKLEHKKFLPFAEILLGESHLHQEIRDTVGTINVSAGSTNFTWVLGGGLDYTMSEHWLARANADLVRTHFADAGQSHLRLGLGIVYVF
jgi:hypothetical protein